MVVQVMPFGQYVISLSEDPISWLQARKVAQGLGGDLASLSGQSEQKLIFDTLSMSNTFWSVLSYDRIGPWIGLSQDADAEEPSAGWHWLDGTVVDPRGWHKTQPNNASGQDSYGAIYYAYVQPFPNETPVSLGWADFPENPPALRRDGIYSFVTELSERSLGISGTAGIDHIIANGNDNIIDGRGGADVMEGHQGNDTYYVDDTRDVIKEATNAGDDTVRASVSVSLSAVQEIENIETTNERGGAKIDLTGNGLDNRLIGNAGANVLDGAGGADVMRGLSGNDSYYVDTALDRIVEAGNQGFDQVFSSVTRTLEDHVETLTLIGSEAVNAIGNGLANVLAGNSGRNTLDGRSGADVMRGNGGDDTYLVDQKGDQVFEAKGQGNDRIVTSVSYALRAGQEIEALSLVKGDANLSLYGNEFNNSLSGNDGKNIIDGKAGADTLRGLAGDDTYLVDHGMDKVLEAAGGGFDTVLASASFKILERQEVEVVQLLTSTGTRTLDLSGNEFANELRGNAGKNVLDGGGGIDRLFGGAGDDTYLVDNARDAIFEAAGQGSDAIIASVSYQLASGQEIETLQLAKSTGLADLSLIGNEFDQSVFGNGGDNLLDGKGGVDSLFGKKGDDVYRVDDALDRVVEAGGEGSDTVLATVSYRLAKGQEIETLQVASGAQRNVALTGNEYRQALIGDNTVNALDGGQGADILTGRGGADLFVFSKALGPSNIDQITDFSHRDDTIRLSKSIFSALTAGSQTKTGAFLDVTDPDVVQGRGDHLLYDRDTGGLSYDADANGKGLAIRIAILTNRTAIDGSDFIVV